jgi:long-chain acyl-CoA synthetase
MFSPRDSKDGDAMRQATASDTPAYPWLKSYPGDVDWGAEIAVKPMHTLLETAAARFGSGSCIDFLDRRYSFAEIGRLADRAAQGFQALGVGRGVKVGLHLPNCPYFVICYYAVLKAGGTVVNFNPLYSVRELAHQIEDSETDIMVTLDAVSLHDKLAPLVGASRLRHVVVCRLADALPFPRSWLYPWVMRHEVARIPADGIHLPFRRLIANDGTPKPVAIDPQRDVALLQYTGGTTGVPKAAMLTHANLYANAEQCARWFAHAPAGPRSILGILPLFHVFAMTVVMNWSLHEGAEMILLPRFKLKDLLRTIARKKPTALAGVPTLFNAMLNAPDLARYDLSSLHYCLSGGAALPNELRLAFERTIGARVLEGYGLSETSPVACCNPVNPPEAVPPPAGSVGLPYPRTVISIRALDPPHQLLGPGETGEICIAGPQVMAGYWKQPEETKRALADGLFATGDIGHMDEKGYVFITDRLKDMINASGFKIYPRNIEEVVLTHPAVLECAVVGVPDSYRGETVKAFVALKPGQKLTAEALTVFLADKLSALEVPKQIEFRASLPKTAVGKISKKDLLAEGTSA